jgi:ATP-dependent helicase/nuclease subunit A
MIPAAQDIEEAKIQLNLYPIDRSQVLNQQRQPNPASRLNQWQKLVNQPDDPDLKQQIEKQMSYTYPYQADTESQPKITVTELKRAALALENPQQDAIYHTPIPTSFEQLAHPDITAGQQGTLYHQIMEKLDLHNPNAESQLENLTATGFISPTQKQRIDSGRIQSFLDSQIGQRMAKAEKVWREQPFVIKVAATELGSITESQEGMLVQGTIDAFFIEEGQAVIVDYKTDKVTDGETLIERYHTQLDFYGQAVTAITGMTVKEKWIYSFVLGQGFKE